MMWQSDWNCWGWGAWCLMFGSIIVIVGFAVWLFANLARRDGPVGGSPEDVLADRFARGELSEGDYLRQRDLIRAGTTPRSPEAGPGPT